VPDPARPCTLPRQRAPLHKPPRPCALLRPTPPPHCSSTGPRRDRSLTLGDHHDAWPSRRLHPTPPPRPAACHHRAAGRPVPSHSATFTPSRESRPSTSPDGSTPGYFHRHCRPSKLLELKKKSPPEPPYSAYKKGSAAPRAATHHHDHLLPLLQHESTAPQARHFQSAAAGKPASTAHPSPM
jgi:hypothetical protein